MNPYTVDHFIAKFEATKEEEWTTGLLSDGKKHCALGHCGTSLMSLITNEGFKLNAILKDRVIEINDWTPNDYPQPTPRQRILAALRDVKRGEFK